MKDEDKNQVFSRIVTFIVVALILVQTRNITHTVSAYEQMYENMGTGVGLLASFFFNTPIWMYWLVATLFSLSLIAKDHYLQKPITRFLSNIAAYLATILVTVIINSIVTSGVIDLLPTLR